MEGSSATGLGPLQPPPLGRVKSVASPPYPLGLSHYPPPWPLTFPEEWPRGRTPYSGLPGRQTSPSWQGTLRRGLLEGGFSEDILSTALPRHTLTLQDLDTARHTAGTWQIPINSLLSLAMAKTLGRISPLQTGAEGRSGCSESRAAPLGPASMEGPLCLPSMAWWEAGTWTRCPLRVPSALPLEAGVTGSCGFMK